MTIVMTGASGVVGEAILRELVRRDRTDEVICVTHRGQVSVPGVSVIRSELTRPRLGLSDADYAYLVDQADVIIHAGALTEWGRSEHLYREVNVGGTQRIIELAHDADAMIHQISTSFVAALAQTTPVTLSPDNVVTNYVRSKQDSDDLLRDSEVPHNVYRPTNLIGDSETGATIRGQIVQLVATWLLGGRAPLFPAHEGNLIDLVSQDLLAIAVINAIDARDVGGDYWVTYGTDAMSVADVLKLCAEQGRALGRDVDPPPIVHPDEIDLAELDRMPLMTRNYIRVLMDVSEITAASGGALPTSMPELRDRLGVPAITDVDAFRRNLGYWSMGG